MKNTFLYLSSCSTCVRIVKALNIKDAPFLQDVKNRKITPEQLAFLYAHTHSYETLINKRGRVYAQLKKDGKSFTESTYKALIDQEYSCLKRPILIWNDEIFLGNSKATFAQMKDALHG